ncbi:hypothetical protein SAMN03097699_2258 [Flavobacteriaceae bacterium MAR_2010_188]|nr:hypothetical protein SAMN03097699_2258 [Flavobacteriaceae bacterium MAR_2010_188]
MFKVKTKILGGLAFLFLSIQSFGQCAMCRAVLESEDGQSTAAGVNNGIMYLMSIPYLLVAAIGLIIYFQFFRPKNKIN